MTWRTGLLVMLLAAAACRRESPAATEPASSQPTDKAEVAITATQQREGGIDVQPARAAQAAGTITVPGHIVLADNRTWRVGIRTDGVVVAALVGIGDYVRKGQVLARYHADEVRDSRARYRAAQAELERATSNEALAQRNADRAQKLLDLKAGSAMQVEQARQDLATAHAAVRSATAEVDRLKDLLEDDLRVPADPTPGDDTADQVPILAPASGYVIEKNVTLGRAIHTDDDTFTIGDLSQVWMLASVRQEQLGQLRVGQRATVTLNGVADARFPGRIANVGQELDPATRAMQVRIVLDNPGGRLRPEMLGTAAIEVGGATTVVSVPSDAVQQVNGADVVFVRVAPDRFALRPVHAGTTANGETPIVSGLEAGEPVVTRGSFVVKSQLLRASLEGDE